MIPQPCYCGSGELYSHCCAPYLAQQKIAPSAEKLMRSRFTAYAIQNTDYLLSSWHPKTRPENLDAVKEQTSSWLHLKIYFTNKGSTSDQTGTVAFIATYTDNNKQYHLCEKSYFEQIENKWYYHNGDILTPSKNSDCLCGSKKKFKRCCGK